MTKIIPEVVSTDRDADESSLGETNSTRQICLFLQWIKGAEVEGKTIEI